MALQTAIHPSIRDGLLYPGSVLSFNSDRGNNHGVYHPTQKPLDLMMWLVETYTNPGDLVIDPFMGAGTTALACARTGRRFVGIEREQRYFDMAVERLKAPPPANLLPDEHVGLALFSANPEIRVAS